MKSFENSLETMLEQAFLSFENGVEDSSMRLGLDGTIMNTKLMVTIIQQLELD